MSARIRPLPLTLLLLLLAAAGGLTIYNLLQQLPWALWGQALSAPNIDDVRQMLFHYSLLPRLSVSLLAGAGLGGSGWSIRTTNRLINGRQCWLSNHPPSATKMGGCCFRSR